MIFLCCLQVTPLNSVKKIWRGQDRGTGESNYSWAQWFNTIRLILS